MLDRILWKEGLFLFSEWYFTVFKLFENNWMKKNGEFFVPSDFVRIKLCLVRNKRDEVFYLRTRRLIEYYWNKDSSYFLNGILQCLNFRMIGNLKRLCWNKIEVYATRSCWIFYLTVIFGVSSSIIETKICCVSYITWQSVSII